MLGLPLVDTRFKTYQQYCFAVLNNLKADKSSYSEDILEKRYMELWVVNSCLTTYKCFERYLRLYEQEQIIANEEGVETLRLGLISFPRLEHITITPEAC